MATSVANLSSQDSGASSSNDLLRIFERANAIASTTGLDDLLAQMLDLIREVCGANSGTLYLYDKTTEELIIKVIKGSEASQRLVGTRISIDTGIAGATFREHKPILVGDLPSDPRWLPARGLDDLQNVYSFPLMLLGEPIGVVQVFNYTIPQFELVQLLGNRMASEVDKAILLDASRQRNARLESLVAIIGQIGSTLDRDQILRMIIEYARELLNSEAASLFLIDEERQDLVLLVSSNINDLVKVEHVHVPFGKGIIGHVVATGETILVQDVKHDTRHYAKVDQKSGFVTRSILAVPLRTYSIALGGERGVAKEHIIGGLEAMNKTGGPFNEDDAQLLRTLTNQAATVLEIATLYSDANDLFFDVIKALTTAIDAKDPYTQGHSQRVSDYSVAIARRLGLPPEVIHDIRIGSLFHDVGKIGIPDAILGKPGRLTDEEFVVMKQHPEIGARIMSHVRMMKEELPALAQHHERLDGKGYPDGLSGEKVSLFGRIVAAADVFDAMTSDRPYRPGMPPQDVFEYMDHQVGQHFDPNCVDALRKAYNAGEIRTQKENESR